MPAQQQQLTYAQQAALRPKRLQATGTFSARIDRTPVLFQTTTLQHNYEHKLISLNARHADNSVTIKEIHIQLPDNVRANEVIHLDEQEFTDVKVWYSIKTPSDPHIMSCIAGTLTIDSVSTTAIKLKGSLRATTDTDPQNNTHTVDVDFDLTS